VAWTLQQPIRRRSQQPLKSLNQKDDGDDALDDDGGGDHGDDEA
jgi:hypothetical protein